MTDMEILCDQATRGYDLDLSGDHFDEGEGALEGFLVYEHPDSRGARDIFPWLPEHLGQNSCAVVYVFKPDELMDEAPSWPSSVPEQSLRLDACGVVYPTDHDCTCFGSLGRGGWNFTGNTLDDPWPKCPRCEGSGLVESPGGYWAVYIIE